MTLGTFRRIFGYTYSVRIRKPVRKRGQDLRDLPLYTIPEAAAFLAIPPRTLHYWFAGSHRVYAPAGEYPGYSLLSFRDAAEAYRLYILREMYEIPPLRIRIFLAALRKETNRRHPLLTSDIKVIEKTLFYDKPPRGKRGREVIDLSGNRQLAIGQLVDQFGKRIIQDKDKRRTPLTIYPWRMLRTEPESVFVSLDPDVMSGSLVVSGTRIPVGIIMGMKLSGKTTQQIAAIYSLTKEEVQKALIHIDRPVQKVA